MGKLFSSVKRYEDDYALQAVPESYKKWSWPSLLGIMLSISTAMFYFQWGGGLVLTYGTKPFAVAMVLATVIIGSIGYYLVRVTSRTSVDTDLLTISSGFGYRGAGITSIIYAFVFLMFFALEGTIMSQAVHAHFQNLPLGLLYIVIGLVFIPLTWYGIKFMNLVMWVTLPIYFLLLIPAVIRAEHVGSHVAFWSFMPHYPPSIVAGPIIIQLLSAVLALIVNATVAGDIGRFIPKRERKVATFVLGYVYQAITFCGAAMLGAWFAVKMHQTDPGVYIAGLLGFWGVLFVLVTQLRINVLNTYGGSLSFANFFARIINFKPGRQWMVVLVALISIIFMFVGILSHLTTILSFESIFILAWIMAVISDIAICKSWLKLEPSGFEFSHKSVENFNPVGLTALCIALSISLPLGLNVFGPYWQTFGAIRVRSCSILGRPGCIVYL